MRVSLNDQGDIIALDGSSAKTIASYKQNTWINIKVEIDASLYGKYSLWIDDKKVVSNYHLAEAVTSVERVSFRTGSYRDIPNRKTPNEDPEPPLPGADVPVNEAIFLLDNFTAKQVQ